MLTNKIKALLITLIRNLEKRKILPDRIYNRIKNFSLAGKINFIILAAAVPMMLILCMLFLFLFVQLKKQLDTALVQKMVAARNAYNYYERTTLVYAKLLAENPYIKKELLAETVNIGPILRVCNQVKESVFLNQITVYDKKGFVVIRSHKPTDFGDDGNLLKNINGALKKGENTANLIFENNTLILQNTVPIYFEGDVVGAIVAGYILNEDFAKSISGLTQSGISFILNGKIISSSYKIDFKSEEEKKYEEENKTWSLSITQIVTESNGNKEKVQLDFRYLPIVTEAGSPEIQKAGIAISLKPPFSKSLLFILFWGSFILTLGIILLGIILALKIGHNIAAYATSISNTMTEYADGNLDIRVKKESADELGKVANGFNYLAAELKKRMDEIREANETLELKVIERTKDLNSALENITYLKEIQEGDYYLTALLLKPLLAHKVYNGKVNAEYLIDQKKKYNFRGRKGEIGGDYCLFAKIRFQKFEGEWLFFFNGDAMGKSSQGASGALVCGVTLHSILSRALRGEELKQDPANFLSRSFSELNDIFTLFDGSMLMSAICGLVQIDTGLMYYFNCEHPWTVLLRDNKAEFIENELTMRKLGMPQENNKLKIRKFQLQIGDVLIAGSDGRDDLEIDGVMNSEENRFIEVVEFCNGDLNGIVDRLDCLGSRSDDLSLIKLEFTG